MAAPSYHLWLKPGGQVYDILAETIRTLAEKFDAPIFEPHVTLLGGLAGSEVEHLRRTKELAGTLRAFHITLAEARYRDEYFRCLFRLVEQTPAVMEANLSARRIFDQVSNEGYMPHASLLYGIYPANRKREQIAMLPDQRGLTFETTAIVLIRADSEAPKDWHEILTAPMGAAPRGGAAP